MGKANNAPPIKLKHRIVYGAYRTLEFILKPLPMKLVCLIGMSIGHVTYLLMPGRRAIVTRNLRIAFGKEMSLDEIHNLTRKTFHRAGANLIASIRTSSYTKQQIRNHVEIIGQEHLDNARTKGTGVIALLPHMGNWELLAQAHLVLPALIPPATLYRPIDNPLIDKLIKRRRGSEGTKLFSRRDGFFKPIAHIKKGGTLGILADQQAGAHGLAVPFFGKLTSMTNLPAIMHRRTGASIVPISMTSSSLGKWKLTVHPAIEIPHDKKADTQHITSLCAVAYEAVMRAEPADVLWMHGYWKTGRKRPLKIDGLRKNKSTSTQLHAEKPFRIMVYTGDATPTNQEIVTQLDRLKKYRPDLHLTTVGQHRISSASDHYIQAQPLDSSPQLTHTVEQYTLSLSTPIDCALDFTKDGQGGELFDKAKISHIFTLDGRFQSRRTAGYFSKITQPTLADFLDSLGIMD
jgi:lauroyl/myristoyl acyltransferase